MQPKEIRHKEFARRMEQACDGNPDIPQPNFGRLKWFVDRLDEHGIHSTNETVRKWFYGETMPRNAVMTALAQIMKVDLAWLSVGKSPEIAVREQKLRDAAVDGVVNVVAGFVQMSGANPAFPSAGDQRAEKESIDLYAIIRGVQYAFHVALAVRDGDGWRFSVPSGAANTFILGVVPSDNFAVRMFEIEPDVLVAYGKRKSGHIELIVDRQFMAGETKLREILTFAERL